MDCRAAPARSVPTTLTRRSLKHLPAMTTAFFRARQQFAPLNRSLDHAARQPRQSADHPANAAPRVPSGEKTRPPAPAVQATCTVMRAATDKALVRP